MDMRKKFKMFIQEYRSDLMDLHNWSRTTCGDRVWNVNFTSIYFDASRPKKIVADPNELNTEQTLSLRTTIDTELPDGVPGCGDLTPSGIPTVKSVAEPADWCTLPQKESPTRSKIEMMQNVIHN